MTLTMEGSTLVIEYHAASEFDLRVERSRPWPPGWSVVFWRPGEPIPVHIVTAAVAPESRQPVALVCDDRVRGSMDRGNITRATPDRGPIYQTDLRDGDIIWLGMLGCGPYNEHVSVEAEGSTLTVRVPLSEVPDLPRRFEWMADVSWTDPETNQDRFALLPEQPDHYDGWPPNRVSFPQQSAEASSDPEGAAP